MLTLYFYCSTCNSCSHCCYLSIAVFITVLAALDADVGVHDSAVLSTASAAVFVIRAVFLSDLAAVSAASIDDVLDVDVVFFIALLVAVVVIAAVSSTAVLLWFSLDFFLLPCTFLVVLYLAAFVRLR